MSRGDLAAALRTRDGSVRALVPLIARHAARLEQVDAARLWREPAVAAACFSTVARIYPVDSVTPVVDAGLLEAASRAAGAGDVGQSVTPSPEDVLAQPGPVGVPEVVRRLRPVLGRGTGISVVLPSPSLLAASLGQHDADWASAVVMGWLRAFGPEQPDVYLELRPTEDDDPLDGGVRAMADHFDVPVVPMDGGTNGVVALDPASILDGTATIPRGTWLVTTAGEFEEDVDPAAMRAGLEWLRSGGGVGR